MALLLSIFQKSTNGASRRIASGPSLSITAEASEQTLQISTLLASRGLAQFPWRNTTRGSSSLFRQSNEAIREHDGRLRLLPSHWTIQKPPENLKSNESICSLLIRTSIVKCYHVPTVVFHHLFIRLFPWNSEILPLIQRSSKEPWVGCSMEIQDYFCVISRQLLSYFFHRRIVSIFRPKMPNWYERIRSTQIEIHPGKTSWRRIQTLFCLT